MSKICQKTTSNGGFQRRRHSQVWCCASKAVRTSLHQVCDLVNPGNADERKEVVRATRQLVLFDSNSKIGFSQVSRQEKSPQASRKLVLEDENQTESDEREHCNAKSSRKLAASSPELKNLKFTNHRYMGKIFQCLQKKLGMSATNASFSMDAYKTNVLVW